MGDIDNSDVVTFDELEEQPTHGPCPRCGQDGGGHVTIFDANGRLGRRCLECNYTFPIHRLEERP